MGSVRSLLGMFPGISEKIKDTDIDERQFVRIQAMITSMTEAERNKPSIINPSRKKRIAKGSGCKVEDVNRLLRQFEQMQGVMKQFGKNGKATKKIRKRLAGMDLRKFGN